MPRRTTTKDVQKFYNRPAQTATTIFFGFMVILSLGMIVDASSRVVGLIFLAGSMAVFVRACISPRVDVGPDRIALASLFRTRRIELSEIESIDVAVGRTGMNGFGREFLVLQLHDGVAIRFTDMNAAPPKTEGGDNVVREVARLIKDRIA